MVLAVLVITVQQGGGKTMSIMSEYFRNCSNNWITFFELPKLRKKKKPHSKYNISVHSVLYLKYETFVLQNLLEEFKSAHDLLWQGWKKCLKKHMQKIILLIWLEVVIAVLQRLFSICISNLEEVVNNAISFLDQGLHLFADNKDLSVQVCCWFCIYITVSVSLLQFYTFLYNPIGAHLTLRLTVSLHKRLDFSPVSEVWVLQPPSSISVLSFASFTKGLNQAKLWSQITKASSEQFFLMV